MYEDNVQRIYCFSIRLVPTENLKNAFPLQCVFSNNFGYVPTYSILIFHSAPKLSNSKTLSVPYSMWAQSVLASLHVEPGPPRLPLCRPRSCSPLSI